MLSAQQEKYLKFLEHGRKLAPNTIKGIRNDFEQYTGDLDNATRSDIEMFIIDQNEQKLSSATVKRRITSLKGYFNWQIYNDLRLGNNPCDGNITPKVKHNHHKAITYDELMKLYINAPTDVLKFAISLMGFAGMRIGEVIGMGEHNKVYHDENGVLAVSLVQTKNDRERDITLGHLPNVELIENITDQGGVYGRRGKLTSNGLWRQLKKYSESMGIDNLSPHDLRATFATVSDSFNIKETVVRDVLGHTTTKNGNAVTNIYIDTVSVEEQFKELQKGWC